MDGAGRLGGKALSEILVFGARAGGYAVQYAAKLPRRARLGEIELFEPMPGLQEGDEQGICPVPLKRAIQQIMWEKVGVIREGQKLQKAREEPEELERKQLDHPVMQCSLTVYNREILDSIEVRKWWSWPRQLRPPPQCAERAGGSHED